MKTEKRDRVIELLELAAIKLEETGKYSLPDSEERKALWQSALGPTGSLRSKSTPDASEAQRAFLGILRWHMSGGNLGGLFTARFRVDASTYDRLETLGSIWAALVGSPATDRWSQVLGR